MAAGTDHDALIRAIRFYNIIIRHSLLRRISDIHSDFDFAQNPRRSADLRGGEDVHQSVLCMMGRYRCMTVGYFGFQTNERERGKTEAETYYYRLHCVSNLIKSRDGLTVQNV